MNQQPNADFVRKCCCDEENEPEHKKQKAEITNMTETEPSTFGTKLTDVNDDCLEKVFMHLSLDDLLNIAHTNKQLKSAADMVFARKFGKKAFDFRVTTLRRNKVLDTRWNIIFISDLKTSLRLLRCYGHLILHLAIRYSKKIHSINMLRYTNQYCFELKTIEFFGIFEAMFENFMENSFPKIETVKFNGCFLGKLMSQFNTWFPAMRRLSLKESRLTDPSSVEVHFPHLKQLKLFSSMLFPSVCSHCFTSEKVKTMFRLNPQLERLSLYDQSEYLRSASQYLPQLEYLVVNGFHFSSDETIHFKSVRYLNINFGCCDEDDGELPRINLTFDQLEQIEICLGAYRLIDAALDFFKKHQSIAILTLRSVAKPDTSKVNVMSIFAVLSLLNDIEVYGPDFSIDEIIHLLTESELVKRFRFYMSNPNEFDRLKKELGDKWDASKTQINRVELKRKT